MRGALPYTLGKAPDKPTGEPLQFSRNPDTARDPINRQATLPDKGWSAAQQPSPVALRHPNRR